MIFYFTATGNSLYAVKYLEEETVSIPPGDEERSADL